MTTESTLIIDTRGHVLTVTFANEVKANALGAAELSALQGLISDLKNPECPINVVVLNGLGPTFCAGVDLSLINEKRKHESEFHSLILRNSDMLLALEHLPQLLIVALNGPAVGLGAHIALCADFTLALENSYLAFPEAKLGFPDVVHAELLLKTVGRSAAIRLLLGQTRLDSQSAVQAGLFHTAYRSMESLEAGTQSLINELEEIGSDIRRLLKQTLGAVAPKWQTADQLAAVRQTGN